MVKYISLGIIAIVLITMLVCVFIFDIILNPFVWLGIVLVLAVAVVMYSRAIDEENI